MMKNKLLKSLRVVLSSLLVVSLFPTTSWAVPGDDASIAAASTQAFDGMLAPQGSSEDGARVGSGSDLSATEAQNGLSGLDSSDARDGMGHKPDTLPALSVHDENAEADGLSTQAALPRAYSSRDKGFVMPVRDQGQFGTCWSFSTVAAMESSLLAHHMASSADLSERHLAYFTYHAATDPLGNTEGDSTEPRGSSFFNDWQMQQEDPYLGTGGNSFIASNVLASWKGAANEDVASYDELLNAYATTSDKKQFLRDTALPESVAYASDSYHVQGTREIAMSDRDDVKRAVMENGAAAVAISYTRRPTSYYDQTNNAQYCYNDEATNHEVAIVGWDDDYSRQNFWGGMYTSNYGYMDPSKMQRSSPLSQASPVWVPAGGALYSFKPTSDGLYLFSGSNGTGSINLTFYRNGLQGAGYYFPEFTSSGADGSCSFKVNLQKGITYYIASSNQSAYRFAVSRVGNMEPIRPSSNGAWLVKNSYGTSENDSGYFWISYEDKSLHNANAKAVVFQMESADNYDNNYQYDGTAGRCYNIFDSGGSIANTFTAKANEGGAEELKAVSFSLNDVNVDYSVQVYVNVRDAADPTSGSPVMATPVTGKTSYAGYYTVPLPRSVYLDEGTKYSIVVTLSHADGSDIGYCVDTTYGAGDRYGQNWSWAHFTSAVAAGQSFKRVPGDSAWTDLSTVDTATRENEPHCVARIKAFTDNVPASEAAKLNIEQAVVKVSPPSVLYDGTEKKPDVTVTYGGARLVKGTDYELQYARNVEVGIATVTVIGKGDYEGSQTASFIISRASASKPRAVNFTYDGKVHVGVMTGEGYTLHGTTSAAAVGAYTVTATLEDGYQWSDGTINDITLTWKINAPAVVPAPSVKPKAPTVAPAPAASKAAMHRLYNPWSGEHFYTGDASERNNLVRLGWKYEGVGWYAPASGTSVHRLYNPYTGDHHFTTNTAEKNACVSAGWRYEGVGWKSGGTRPVYREYNPYAAAFYHNYTASAQEHGYLCSIGWKGEGVGWYGV